MAIDTIVLKFGKLIDFTDFLYDHLAIAASSKTFASWIYRHLKNNQSDKRQTENLDTAWTGFLSEGTQKLKAQ